MNKKDKGLVLFFISFLHFDLSFTPSRWFLKLNDKKNRFEEVEKMFQIKKKLRVKI